MNKTILPFCCAAAVAGMAAYALPPVVRLAEGDRKAAAITGEAPAVGALMLPGRNASGQHSPAARLGENNPLLPPFCETFDNFRTEMEHDDFTRYFQVIDANDDNRYWGLYNYAGERPYGRCAYMLFPIDKAVGNADDWLVTRAVRLEAGKYYRVSLDASLFRDDDGTTPQVFEVKCGMYNDPEGMSTLVVPATDVSSTQFTKAAGWFVPPFDGLYYVGVHGISPVYDSYYNYLFINNIAVDAARVATVPSDVTDIEMTNDPDGSTRIDISFKAPAVDLAGNPLQGNLTVAVLRDDVEIARRQNVIPGAECNISDTPAAEGDYRYSFRASNASGEGADVVVNRYAGIAAPVAPVVTLTEEVVTSSGYGMHCQWTVPSEDVNGRPINTSKIRYDVYDVSTGQESLVAASLDKPEFTVSYPEAASGQMFATVIVRALFDDKESKAAASDMIAIGPPDVLPYHNSFTVEDYYKYLLAVELKDDATWRFLDDLSDPNAQDGDNGYISMICNVPGGSCELQTGKIDFTGATAPALSFYTYVYEMDENLINVKVIDVETGCKETVSTFDLSMFGRAGWNKIVCPLEDYAGKTVSLVLEGIIQTHGYIPVDNMTVAQLPDVDLAVGDIDYPRGAETGKPIEILAEIRNNGMAEVSAYTVSLKRDGKTVDTVEGFAVGSLDSADALLTDVLPVTAQTRCSYVIEIETAGDANADDNVSAPFHITAVVPTYAAVNDLKCTGSGADVRLDWSAPDPSKGGPEAVLEDFEAYEAFETQPGSWITIDQDGGYVGGFNGYDMPVDRTQQSWWVMTDDVPFSFMRPYSGHNLLVQMYGFSEDGRSDVAADDWLISPELFGGRQTVSFWASSISGDYGLETMEVYWSDGGTRPEDFRLAQENCEVPVAWTRYFVGLPDGARRFAVRATSPAGYMLWLDDIEYVPAGKAVPATLLGYNVYRNGELQNATPVSATTFATSQTGENDAYFVTAVYDKGESAASNVVGFSNASVGITIDDAASAQALWYSLQGMPVDPSRLSPGVYVRVCGGVAERVMVR